MNKEEATKQIPIIQAEPGKLKAIEKQIPIIQAELDKLKAIEKQIPIIQAEPDKLKAIEKQMPIIQAELDKLKAIIDAPDRMTKEQRFYELANNLTQKFDKDKYPNSVFYFKGDDCFFEIENSTIWCSHKNVWSVFEKEDGMEYDNIQSFIGIMVEECFKRKGLTPALPRGIDNKRAEAHFQNKI